MSTVYRMSFNNFEEQAVTGTLTNEAGDLDIIDIDAAEDCIRIVTQDNEEDKFTPIKAKKCIFKFFNSPEVNLRTFATGEDNTWRAEVKINGQLIFIGWLEQGDITEPFLYQENQIVTLTAIDGLGYLDDIRLVGFSGDNTNNYVGDDGIRIIDWLGRALFRTGFQLNINVINNLREENNDDTTDPDTFGNIYATCNLFAKTFEDKIGEAVSCRKVLEIILGHDCFITQAKGEWWIVRVREYLSTETRKVTVFDYLGNPLSFTTGDYEKAIGLNPIAGTPFAESPDATAFFSLARTNWLLQRPYKSTKLIFNYQYPLEIICNSALLRGDLIGDLPDETDADGNTLTVQNYEIDCWNYLKYTSTDPPVLTTQDSSAYIKVRYREGHEVERYIHFEATAAWPAQYRLINASDVETGISDRFTLSFSFKWSSDLGGSKPYVVRMAEFRLIADDGTFWAVQGGNQDAASNIGPFWMETDSNFKALVPFGVIGYPSLVYAVNEGTDLSQWIDAVWNIPSAPRSGIVQFLLLRESEDSTATQRDVSPISLVYHPFVGGSYDVFTGQSYTSTQSGDFRRSLEEEVFMSNAPRKLIKGAMLVLNDASRYVLAGQFYEGLENTSPPATLYDYGELQERAFQNQHRNSDEVYRATCQGLTEGEIDGNGMDDHQDLIHKYYNRDTNPGDNDKVLQLVTQDVDVRNCEWTGTLILNSDESIGEVLDPIVFQYEADGSGSGGSGGGSGGGGGTGGAIITADNGLTANTPTNVELGGMLKQSTSINADIWNLQVYGDNAGTVFEVDNIHADPGISFTATSNGIAIYAITTSEILGALNLQINGTTNNSVGSLLIGLMSSSGTPASGFGGSFDFYLMSTVQPRRSNQLISLWTVATDATITSQFKITGVLSAVEGDIFKANGDGSWDITPITATAASAITPTEGKILFVNSTNGTFTSIGLWCYENGAWSKK